MRDLVLVLTMGRVASTTVQRSVTAALGSDVFHVHHVNPSLLATQVARAGSIESAARSVKDGLAAAKALIGHTGTVKIITLVRDVIARNLSAAFEQQRKSLSPSQLDAFIHDADRVQSVWAKFYDKRPHTWFDVELREVFGIDVYAHSFPDLGLATIREGRTELLVMRSELDDATKSRALAQFLHVADVPLQRFNDHGRQEDMAQRYAKFRTAVNLNERYLVEQAKSRYMRHFYAGWSVKEYVNTWLAGRAPQ